VSELETQLSRLVLTAAETGHSISWQPRIAERERELNAINHEFSGTGKARLTRRSRTCTPSLRAALATSGALMGANVQKPRGALLSMSLLFALCRLQMATALKGNGIWLEAVGRGLTRLRGRI
jgi:hypothetical protein